MCNVPPKFYQLCRLCLSIDKKDAALSIFDDVGNENNIPTKIMTCLSILASDSLFDNLRQGRFRHFLLLTLSIYLRLQSRPGTAASRFISRHAHFDYK